MGLCETFMDPILGDGDFICEYVEELEVRYRGSVVGKMGGVLVE